jgi:hypothetical protein
MGTRSTIALEFADGTVQQVYCHWDGYLDNNGKILAEHYSNPFKLRELIDLGDLSSLKPEIGEKHAFSSFELRAEEVAGYKLLTENWCTFYGRDRGETNINARKYKNTDEYFDCSQQEEYDYILRTDGVWYVRCFATEGVWATMPEAEALINQMNKEGVY